MWAWIMTALDSAALLVLMRWLFHLSTPRRDLWHAVEWLAHCRRALAHLRVRLFGALGATDLAWRRLRDRYQAGKYGVEGT